MPDNRNMVKPSDPIGTPILPHTYWESASRAIPPIQVDGDITIQGMRVEIRWVDVTPYNVAVCVAVAERDTGQPVELVFNSSPPCKRYDDPSERARMVKRAILEFLSHELDELIMVRGKRVHEAHDESRPEIAKLPRPVGPPQYVCDSVGLPDTARNRKLLTQCRCGSELDTYGMCEDRCWER